MKNKRVHGYITIYLSLTLGILITLITTLLQAAVMRTIRFRTECAMNAGLESIFAEYHRELLKQYGLLFIDSSYGTANGTSTNTQNRLLHYLNLNLKDDSDGLLFKDLTDTRADNTLLSDISYASDNGGEVLRYQIDRYMKVKYGIGYLPVFQHDSVDIESSLNEYESYDSDRRASSDEVDSIMDEINSQREEDEEEYSISNPADSVEYYTESNMLYYAFGDITDKGFRSTDTSACISHRTYDNGAGLRTDQNKPDGLDAKLLLTDYIYDVCGYYREEKADSGLLYEVEYIVNGENSDIKNMEDIAGKIFKIRYALNMGYLLTSSSKQAEAEAMALAATSAIGLPELAEAVKYTILFSWGYAESAKDLRILYDGHRLTTVKSDATWNTPLSQMIDFKAHLSEYSVYEGEMDYKTYLDLFLFAQSTENITMRLMDIMEMDIRLTPGNLGFQMDDQIYQLLGEANISGRFGYGCSIKRYYSYE